MSQKEKKPGHASSKEVKSRLAEKALKSVSLSFGEQIAAFEAAVRSYTGSKHVLAVSSKMKGLYLCLRAADVGPGDLVITTPFSDGIAIEVLLSAGAIPVFVDVEPRTGNIDPYLVFAASQDIMQGGRSAQAWLPPKGASADGKLKAILPMDVSGQPADLEPILDTAWKYKLKVIEDAGDTIGAVYKRHPAGSLGDYSAFGFEPVRQSAAHEVGMVITDEDEAFDLVRALSNQDLIYEETSIQLNLPGDNYPLDETTVALGLTYLQHLDERLARRNRVAKWYDERLAEISGIEIPNIAEFTTRSSWSAYVVRIAPGVKRELIVNKLETLGIKTRPYLLPIHLRAGIREHFGFLEGTFPVTEDLGRRSLSMPFSDSMKESQVERVCRIFREVIQ